jgi:hypothetical protein
MDYPIEYDEDIKAHFVMHAEGGVGEGQRVELHDNDDEASALRTLALRIHLDNWTDVINERPNHLFEVNPHQKTYDLSPEEAVERIKFVRESLAKLSDPWHGYLKVHTWSLQDLRTLGYDELNRRLQRQCPNELKVGTHDLLNTLYFLTGGKGDKTGLTLCEAWNGVPQDRREWFATTDSEYLVLTDDEADKLWDEELDHYIDECLEIPDAIRMYFDVPRWKADARIDGRGHSLSSYDGNEYRVEVNGQVLFIYRTN